MATKTSSDKKAIRKAILIGIGVGVIVMPIFFFLVSVGSGLTGEKVVWLCINSTCTGVIIGGGTGYLLVSNDIRFY